MSVSGEEKGDREREKINRLMVAVSPSPFSESLILWARRAAMSVGADLIAVHVETPRALSAEDRSRLERNISLARSLGAEIVLTRDTDVTDGLLRVARNRGITQIVAGKPGRRSWKDMFFPGSPVRRLIRESGKIDISVIRAESVSDAGRHGTETAPVTAGGYRALAAIGLLSASVALNQIFLPYIGPRSVALVLLLTVALAALFLSRAAVVLYATASALLWNFLFIPPRFTFYIHSVEDAILFFTYFFIAVVIGSLTTRIRIQERNSQNREEQLNVLYTMTKQFSSFQSIDDASRNLAALVRRFLGADSAVYIADGGALPAEPRDGSTTTAGPDDRKALLGAFSEGIPTGRFTSATHGSRFMFVPLKFSKEACLGVLGILFPANSAPSMNDRIIIEALAAQFALFIERDRAARDRQKAIIHEESEKLYRVLLDSVSHELKTPLSAIKGSISTIIETDSHSSKETRTKLLDETAAAAERLIRMVDNLLDMGRIDSGRLVLNSDWNDIEDIIGVTLERANVSAAGRVIHVQCPDDIPLVRVDYNLVSLALYGLVTNALAHAGPGAEVDITVERGEPGIRVTVGDNGPGFDEKDLQKVFEKFYRGTPHHASSGLGLGLSISRGIAELHGGTVMAGNRKCGGGMLILVLPVQTMEKNGE